ncbi:MAG TPA: 2-amino-4-hydroxy-6-hydroxymethyldihydropteridine diphosphokinase [Solirubrobacteraceae bacterium]|nr:2-amino-4-hydroxy-6-hydroxymethyldihydropteridine diphosphokinase [Solirubrobacteraceae bacterium]
MTQRYRGYLGLGSNVGDRRSHLEAAVRAMPDRGIEVLTSSAVYETEPVGLVSDQRDFLNACIRIATGLDPEQLLQACKEIEQELGRRGAEVRHGPREIDVDLLILDAMMHTSKHLTVPHPSVVERRFVLVPLLELDPDLTLPNGTPLAGALARLPPGQAVRRCGPPLM